VKIRDSLKKDVFFKKFQPTKLVVFRRMLRRVTQDITQPSTEKKYKPFSTSNNQIHMGNRARKQQKLKEDVKDKERQ